MHTINNKAPERPDMPNIEQASTSQGLYPNFKRSVSSYYRYVTGLDSGVDLKIRMLNHNLYTEFVCKNHAKSSS